MGSSGLKADALETGRLLAEAEAAGPTPELTALHDHLRRCLYRHRRQMGLSSSDVSEIDNAGVQLFGGTPKGPAPEEV